MAQRGQFSARRQLVDVFSRRLVKMAAHYARRSGEDRDDLLQEAWIGFFEGLAELDVQIGEPEHYLVKRARWRLLGSIRHERLRRAAPLEDAPEPAIEPSPVPLGEFVLGLRETQRGVCACLLEGMTFREMGDELGCSSANIAYHVRLVREAYLAWDGAPGERQKESAGALANSGARVIESGRKGTSLFRERR